MEMLCLASDEDDALAYVQAHRSDGVWHIAWPGRLDRLIGCPVFDRMVVTHSMAVLRDGNPEWFDTLMASVRKRVRSQVSA